MNPATTTKRRPGSAADLAELEQPVTRRALGRQRATEYAAAVAAIKQFAKSKGLSVRPFHAGKRCVIVKGSAAKMASAFGASIQMYQRGTQRFRARSGSLRMPSSIAKWT